MLFADISTVEGRQPPPGHSSHVLQQYAHDAAGSQQATAGLQVILTMQLNLNCLEPHTPVCVIDSKTADGKACMLCCHRKPSHSSVAYKQPATAAVGNTRCCQDMLRVQPNSSQVHLMLLVLSCLQTWQCSRTLHSPTHPKLFVDGHVNKRDCPASGQCSHALQHSASGFV